MTYTMSILMREWLLVLPILFLLLGPWLGMAVFYRDRHEMSVAHVAMIGTGAGVAWVAVLATVAYYTGWGLSFVAIGYLCAVPFSLVLLVRAVRASDLSRWRRGGKAWSDSGWQGIALGGAAALTAALQQSPWYGTPDAFYHLAATRSLLATGRPIVTDPFFGTAMTAPDASTGIWNTMQAVVVSVLGVDPASAYVGFTACAAFFMVLAFWVLAYEVSDSRGSASLATLAYFTFAWYTDFRAFAYPNRVGLALAFSAIALFVVIARKPEKPPIAAAVAMAFATLAVHLAAGQLVIAIGASMLLILAVLVFAWRGSESARDTRKAARALLVTGLVAGVLSLPTLYPRTLALKGSAVVGKGAVLFGGDDIFRWQGIWVVRPGGFAFGGAALFWLSFLVGVLAIVEVVRHRSLRAAMALPLIGLAHVFMIFPPVSTPALSFSTYMVARIVELLRFSPYIALAWAMGRIEGRLRPWARVLGIAIIIVALATQWGYVVSTYWQGHGYVRKGSAYSIVEAQRNDVRLAWGFDSIFQMRSIFADEYPLVIADPYASYHLMGLAPVAVVASLPSHTPVFMPEAEADERFDDMTRFFGEHTTSQDRTELLEKYGDAKYVFVWKKRTGRVPTAEIAATPQLKVVFDGPAVLLLEIER